MNLMGEKGMIGGKNLLLMEGVGITGGMSLLLMGEEGIIGEMNLRLMGVEGIIDMCAMGRSYRLVEEDTSTSDFEGFGRR